MAQLFWRNAPEAFAVVEVYPDGTASDVVYGLYGKEVTAKAMKNRADRLEARWKPEASRSTYEVVSVALEWESDHG